MNIQVSENTDKVTIAVAGSLNSNTAPELEKTVEAVFSSGKQYKKIVFDFSHLEYISSAGLRVLMVAYKKVQGTDTKMSAINISGEVLEVLDVTGFTELFEG